MTDVNSLVPTDAQPGDTVLGVRGAAGAKQPVDLNINTLIPAATATTLGVVSVPTSGNLTLATGGQLSMSATGIIAALGFTPFNPVAGGTIAGNTTFTGAVNAPAPTTAQSVATKSYVDGKVGTGGSGGSGLTPPNAGNTVTTLGATDFVVAWNSTSATNEFITQANFISQEGTSLVSLPAASDPFPSSAIILADVGGNDVSATAEQVQKSQIPTVLTTSNLTISNASHNGKLIIANGTLTLSTPTAALLGDNFRCRVMQIASAGTVTFDSGFASASSTKTLTQWQAAEVFATTQAGGSVVVHFLYGSITGTPPGSVVSLTSTAQTTNSITLSWAAGSGGTATSWSVTQRTPTGTGSYVASSGTFTATGGTVTGLTAASSYDFQVVATNAYGSSAPTTLTNVSTLAMNGPSYPSFSTGSPTLLFHMDAANYTGHFYSDTAGTVQAVANGPVKYIKDLSSSGNHFVLGASPATAPTLLLNQANGMAGLSFDGVNNLLSSLTTSLANSVYNSTGLTVYVVVKQNSYVSGGQGAYFSVDSHLGGPSLYMTNSASGGTNGVVTRGGSAYLAVTNYSGQSGAPATWLGYGSQVCLRFNGFGTSGTPYTMYGDGRLNGIATTGANGSNPNNVIYNDNETAGSTFDAAFIGGLFAATGMGGVIFEIMVWSGAAHTAAANADVTTLFSYGTTKYGTGY